MKRRPNEAQTLLADILMDTGHICYAEHKIIATRKWAWDFAIPERKLAIELHGGTWTHGRHTRGAGFQRDREKMNAAQVAGWDVLEFTTEDVLRGRAEKTIAAWLESHK